MMPFKPLLEEDVLAKILDLDVAIGQLTELRSNLRMTLSSEMRFRLEEINEARWEKKCEAKEGKS